MQSQYLLHAIVIILLGFSVSSASNSDQDPEIATPKLPDEDGASTGVPVADDFSSRLIAWPRNIIQLDSDDVHDRIFDSNEVWTVIVHNGSVPLHWLEMTSRLQGVTWVGGIEADNQPELLKKLKVDPSEVPQLVVFPYGPKKAKKGKATTWFSTDNVTKASDAMLRSVPDVTFSFDTSDLKTLLMNCYTRTPTKFPAFLITRGAPLPVYFRSLALRFGDFFTFNTVEILGRKIWKKLVGNRQGPFTYPIFVVLASEGYQPKEGKEAQLISLIYDEEKMGEMSYPSLMGFLFAVNRQYRARLPGNNLAKDSEVLDMAEVFEIEQERFKLFHKEEMKTRKDLKWQEETQQLSISSHDEL